MSVKKNPPTKLYFSVLAANLASFTTGSVFAWTSSSLPRLNGSVDPANNPLKQPTTDFEDSWIASLMPIGAICSTFLAGIASDKFGRKKALIFETVPLFLGIATIAFANEVWHFYLARFMCGFAIGGLFVTLPNYVAEISEKNNRGTLSCLMIVSITLGNLLIYSIGPYLEIKYSSLICLIAPTLFFLVFTAYAPESPYYLIAKGDAEGAEEILSALRGRSYLEVMREFEVMEKVVKEAYAEKTGVLDVIKNRSNLKRLFITFGLMTFQQFSGVNAILFYLQKIFDSSGTTIPAEQASIIIAIVQFLSSLVTPAVIERLGRRFLLFVSGFGTLIPLMAIGVFFHIKNNGGNYESISWLPILSLVVYIFSYNCGFGPIPFTILGEIFAPNQKATASTLSIALCFLFTFTTTVCFPSLLSLIGEAQSFWFFGIFCAASVFFTYFFVPETKGKSLMEIQEMLNK